MYGNNFVFDWLIDCMVCVCVWQQSSMYGGLLGQVALLRPTFEHSAAFSTEDWCQTIRRWMFWPKYISTT